MATKLSLHLPHRKGNARNSEGAFVSLRDGRLLFAYTRYRGSSGADDASADIVARDSADGGRTWSRQDRLLVANEGRCNVMSVSLLRLQDGRIALFYLRKNSPRDCRLYVRRSENEGRTWSAPRRCIPAPGYFVVNNDRVIQLGNGRLMIPTAFAAGGLLRSTAVFFLSDDHGQTWREAADCWTLPVRSTSGLQEPGVIELADGRLYAWARTSTGCQWQMFSHDGGETWTPPQPSGFHSPCAPLSMKRIPKTGHLLAIWNDTDRRAELLPSGSASGQVGRWSRTPLAAAISEDEGISWHRMPLIERDPRRGFCYTAIHFVDDAVLLAYCCGRADNGSPLRDLCIRRITLDWFYDGLPTIPAASRA